MVDRYTKAVLTVIAICLCLITAQNFNIVPSAGASSHDVAKVVICEVSGMRCNGVEADISKGQWDNRHLKTSD